MAWLLGEFHALAAPAWVYEAAPHVIVSLFAFVLGACLGSFANVLVVRLPIGMSVIAPPSRCPQCGVRLRWHDNLPIVGWLALRGRCRACGVAISPQYLLLEIVCGLMLVWIYLVHFASPPHAPWWMDLGGPWWYRNGPLRALPAAIIEASLFVALLAMTKIDARAFIIPMAIPTALLTVALVLWPVQAMMPMAHGLDAQWPIERLAWPGTMAACGGAAGIALAWLGLKLGVVRRSFEDYEEFLQAQQAHRGVASGAAFAATSDDEEPRDLPIELQFLAPLSASAAVGFWRNGHIVIACVLGALAIICLVAPVAFLRGPGAVAEEAPLADYPHARREMWREVLFLLPCMLGLVLGWMAGEKWGGDAPPTGVTAGLGTALAGFLVGGGIVWGVRIVATLLLGREAMGMGDVHLLAAVGAAAGPIVAGSAFFLAPFLGLAWVAAAALLARSGGGRGAVQQGGLPFGPHLALGAVAAVAFRPALSPLWRAMSEGLVLIWKGGG